MSDRDAMKSGPSLRHFGGLLAGFKEWLFDTEDEFSLLRIFLLVFAITVPPLLYGASQYAKNLRRYDGQFIRWSVKLWKDAGNPDGEALTQFAAKQGTGTVASNRVFSINGTNYTTLFARTNLYWHREIGTLFVTADDVLIFLHPSGDYELLADGLLPSSVKVSRQP
jgi:hypothetical protein